MDEPSCSLAIDDGGTRRARSVTSSRISLFFARVGRHVFYVSLRASERHKIAAPRRHLVHSLPTTTS